MLELDRAVGTREMMQKRAKSYLILSLFITGTLLRVIYARDIPLSGDETVSILQASGQAVVIKQSNFSDPISLTQLKQLIDYSNYHSFKDVLDSLTYAGMHPPFYYLSLHTIMRFFGNSTLTLRLISILFSAGSILIVYFLGQKILNERLGFISAFFLSISGYGVQFGGFVRPYSMAMFLALLTTYIIMSMSLENKVSFKDPRIYVYITSAALGLYTIYHFLFVIVFHICFLLLNHYSNRRTVFVCFAMFSIIFVLYCFWIPFLLIQLYKIINNSYYFHGFPNFLLLKIILVEYLFLGSQIQKLPMALFIILGCITYLVLAIGLHYLLKNNLSRFLAISILLYIFSNILVDIIMNTHTIQISKIQFFLVPLLLIILSAGCLSIKNYPYLQIVLISTFALLLLGGSINLCINPVHYDSTYNIRLFRDTIRENLKTAKRSLIITNTSQRRFLLSFAHAIDLSTDFIVIQPKDFERKVRDILFKSIYDTIVVVNFYVGYEKESYYNKESMDFLYSYFDSHDYKFVTVFPAKPLDSWSSLNIFEKVSMP